jgi:uncharacterized Zn finger protein
MSIHVYYTCKHCDEEIEVEVVINEEDDLPENCPACGAPIPDIAHEKVHEDAIERAQDRAEDYYNT